MYDAVREIGSLDEVPPEAGMHSEINEYAAGGQNSADFCKDRLHIVDIGVEVRANDGRKGGGSERKVAYVSAHQMRHSFPSNAELVGRKV